MVAEGGRSGAAAFARRVVGPLEVTSWARARSLLWSASRLCDFALGCGLAPEPDVVLSVPVIERFIVTGTAQRSHPARRTLRSNLLFLAARVGRRGPGPVALGREHAQAPYSDAELARYVALADAQPTPARRARASGLIALGAGAGLIGTDLRLATGRDVQRHDYPSKAHRQSFAQSTGVERSYTTMKDPASTDTTRGWCRVIGLCAVTLFLACAVVVRNERIVAAFDERRRLDEQRRIAGLPPKTRRRRRTTTTDLVQASA